MARLIGRFQYARRYATESGAKGGSNAALYAAGGVGVAGAGYWYFSGTPAAQKAETKIKEAAKVEAKKAFTGGDQGWVSLKLSEVELVNHNTKRLRFELPEGDMVSGLHIASAILTKYKGPEMEKAVLRPYTPISDESMLPLRISKSTEVRTNLRTRHQGLRRPVDQGVSRWPHEQPPPQHGSRTTP